MSYQIPERVRRLQAYDPSTGAYPVRLDANESFFPLGPELMAEVLEAVEKVEFQRYPDPYAAELCAAAADFFGVKPEEVVAGNGSDELIMLILSAFAGRDRKVLVSEPDFSMYRFYSEIYELQCVSMDKKRGSVDIDGLLRASREEDAAVVIFSNPCNPTGCGVKAVDVLRLCRESGALVVVDEAYMDFWSESILKDVAGLPNTLVLKTCSKAVGLAGARVGFAVGNRELIDALKKVKSPFNVNSMSQAAARVVLRKKDLLRERLNAIRRSAQGLKNALELLARRYPEKIQSLPTVTNFALLRCADAPGLYRGLLERGVCVRLSMGDCLRVTAGSAGENAQFLKALEELLREESV